jgi:hypothetical protein
MRRLMILANFHVYTLAPCAERTTRVEYLRGQQIAEADVPADQSADDWIAKGLAEAAE